MDELIYRFLLQSGFPRSSIVSDLDLLPLAGSASQRSNGHALDALAVVPGFAIVDPATGNPLALVHVIGPVDAATLEVEAIELGRYAQRFGGRHVQGFVIRIDADGRHEADKVRFYRVWPKETLQQLSAMRFPDLASLLTLHLLDVRRTQMAEVPSGFAEDFGATEGAGETERGPVSPGGPGAMAWLPGLAVLLLASADWYLVRTTGIALLSQTQALLLVGAGLLMLLPILIRWSRRN